MNQNTLEQLATLAKKLYPDAETRLSSDQRGRIYGTVVSSSFGGVPEEVRQQRLYDGIREQLGAAATAKILFIFTNTPQEDQVFARNDNAEAASSPPPRLRRSARSAPGHP